MAACFWETSEPCFYDTYNYILNHHFHKASYPNVILFIWRSLCDSLDYWNTHRLTWSAFFVSFITYSKFILERAFKYGYITQLNSISHVRIFLYNSKLINLCSWRNIFHQTRSPETVLLNIKGEVNKIKYSKEKEAHEMWECKQILEREEKF
jgi:hypothetical protein